jgi:hypothetical protein
MRALLVLASLVAFAGCTLMLDFGDEKAGRPCDAQGRCVAGYYCENFVCLEGVPCQRTSQCPPSWGCRGGLCQATPDIGVLCATSADCFEGESCYSSSGKGMMCSRPCTASDCPKNTHCSAVLNLADGGTASICAKDCGTDADCGRADHACGERDGKAPKECLPK